MSKRQIIVLVALAAAVGTAACHRTHHGWRVSDNWRVSDDRTLAAPTRLDCPAQEGDLNRVSADADGRACLYQGPHDEEVRLTLTALNGQSAEAVMAPTEAALRGLMAMNEGTGGAAATIKAVSSPEGDHAKVDAPLVHVDANDSNGDKHAKVDVPFVHVDADGDHAHVKVFGVTIDADNDNANVHTNWGSKSAMIKAGPNGAEIRAADQSSHGKSAKLVFILAGDHPGPSGYYSAGYIARGPASGPLVVATFKSKTERGHHDMHDRDLDALVEHNLAS